MSAGWSSTVEDWAAWTADERRVIIRPAVDVTNGPAVDVTVSVGGVVSDIVVAGVVSEPEGRLAVTVTAVAATSLTLLSVIAAVDTGGVGGTTVASGSMGGVTSAASLGTCVADAAMK